MLSIPSQGNPCASADCRNWEPFWSWALLYCILNIQSTRQFKALLHLPGGLRLQVRCPPEQQLSCLTWHRGIENPLVPWQCFRGTFCPATIGITAPSLNKLCAEEIFEQTVV